MLKVIGIFFPLKSCGVNRLRQMQMLTGEEQERGRGWTADSVSEHWAFQCFEYSVRLFSSVHVVILFSLIIMAVFPNLFTPLASYVLALICYFF